MSGTKANLNIRIDKDVKEHATQLLARMGLDQTTAVDMFFRQIIVERRLPFQPTVAQTYGERALELIKRKGIPNITLPPDDDGCAYIDKERYPEIFDWAENG